MALSLGDIIAHLGIDTADFEKGIGTAEKGLSGLGASASPVGIALGAVTAAMAAAAGAGAVAVHSVVAAAERFDDLALRTGIGTSALQEFAVAGGQIGASVESIGNSIFQMEKRLGEESKKAGAGLAALGLSFAELKGLAPEEQFRIITDRLSKVTDVNDQAAISFALFGRGGKEALALVRSGALETAKEAEHLGIILDEKAVGAADRLGDRFAILGAETSATVQQFGAAIVQSAAFQAVVELVIKAFGELNNWIIANRSEITSWVTAGILVAAQAIQFIIETIGAFVAGLGFIALGIVAVKQLLLSWAEAIIAVAAAIPGLGGLGDALLESLDSTRQSIQADAELAAGITSVGESIFSAGQSVEDFRGNILQQIAAGDQATKTHRDLGGAIDEDAAAAAAAAKAHEQLVESLRSDTVQGLTDDMKELEDALIEIEMTGTLTAKQTEDLGKKFDNAREQGAKLGTEAKRLADAYDKNQQKAFVAKAANELFAAALKLASKEIRPMADDLAVATLGLDETGQAALAAALALGSDFPGAPTKAATAMVIFNKKTEKWNALVEQGANLAKLFGDSVGGIVGPLLSLGPGLDTAISGLSAFSAKGGGGFGGLISGLSDFGAESGGSFIKGLTGTLGNVASIAGPIASLVTTAIGIAGKVIGLFAKSEAEKIADEVSRDFGVKISEKLAKQIEETADKLDLGRFEAKLLNLADIVAEAGGAAEFGLDKLSGSIIDLQNAVALGAIPAEEGIAAVGEAFTALAEDAVKAGEVADASLIAVVMRARELGQEIPEIGQFVADQLAQAAEGITALIGTASGEWDEATGGITFGGIQVASVEDAQAQATIFSAAFFATLSEQGLLAAVDAFGPAFEEMQAKLQDFGASIDFGGVARFFELAADPQFRPLLEGIDGLNQALVGLSNSGFLTRDSFAAIQQQGQASFEQLMAAGLTEQEALMQIAPLLQSQIDAANAYGFELDANTQKLIGQAEAAGIGFKTDPMQRMVDVLEVIATKLGATAEELGAVGGAGEVAATQIGDGFAQTTTTVGENMNTLSTTTTETYKSMIDGAISAGASVLAVGGAAIKAAGDFNSLANSARAAAAAAGAVPGPPGGDGGGRRAEGFQFGGLVTGPTLGMLGEAGPELVLPLSQSSRAIEVAGAVSAGRQAPVPMALTIQIGSETFLAEIEDATRTNRIRIHERSIQTFGD